MRAFWSRLLPRRQRIIPFWIIAGVAIAGPWVIAEDGRLGAWWRDLTSGPPQSCTVSSVTDGDTIRAKCAGEGTKIRLHCIDTPEMGQRPWGRESRDALRALLPPRIGLRQVDTDRYGRIVGIVVDPADDTEINLEMVAQGQAAVYPKYCRDQRYYAAQDQAQAAGRGIWSRPGDHQRPWEWRRARR
ncbi:hypothetical protein CKO31_18255 [Thiohalocapsa halophila]|uniref:TNase-like domain-containing protein n=1 Tax=Thiohalocapsa halophila TaxID=69359 RepID=A0ABS1CMD5_9GAMM|nr:thermonuclease family protein [Thiohalocapsa halophila]MBK1632649.1 hypothetical protein [Thiohalocapsa halophila]